MTKFTFDGAEYELENLPKEASGHLHAIQFINAELHRHAMEQASLKTALQIYQNALREAIALSGNASGGKGQH